MADEKTAVIVSGDNWQTLYLNGEKVCSEHRITASDVLELLGYKVVRKDQSDQHAAQCSTLPPTLEEYEREEIEANLGEDVTQTVYRDKHGEIDGMGFINHYSLERITVE